MIECRWAGHEKAYVPVCDICGEELPAQYDFYDAVNAKKAEGWKSRKMDDVWIDICPSCQDDEYSSYPYDVNSAAHEFEGIGRV